MGTIAKDAITLSSVNDAYTVLLTPATCTIAADFDGSHADLTNARTRIVVKRGAKAVDFTINASNVSSSGIQWEYIKLSDKSIEVTLTKIPTTIMAGWVNFDIVTNDGYNYSSTIQFNFSVIREVSMIDWIQDWEGSKTKVGGTYIMTPKLFVGKKEEVITTINGVPTWIPDALTGVYIGPDLLQSGENSAGIYGYFKNKEIFHLNGDGGYIGGWTFDHGGLQSENGVVNILAEGSVFAQNPNSTTPYWGVYADGRAIFANGNVKFDPDGSAEFQGKIEADAGKIGGWKINPNQLYSGGVLLDSSQNLIGVNASEFVEESITGEVVFPDKPTGGVKLWLNSTTDFGLAGWALGEKVFQLGSVNFIAGWTFNHKAIWTGDASPSLTQGSYTNKSGALTLAPNGIRSNSWYIDADGTASFVEGSVKFNTDNGEMFGWFMRDGRFSAKHCALVSDENFCGVFISSDNISDVGASGLVSTISRNGGIYIYADSSESVMRAYDKFGKVAFYLSTTGNNKIANWCFDESTLFIGSKDVSRLGFTLTPGSMALAPSGIYGFLWKLNADGSGAVAGGNITWDEKGNVSFGDSVSLSWGNISEAMGNRFTHIDANGLYTGTIQNTQGTWKLNDDGSGTLANGNISWNKSGVLNVSGNITANTGKIGAWVIDNQKRLASEDGQITLDATSHQIVLTTDEVSSSSEGMLSGFLTFGSKITLSTYNGTVSTSFARTSYRDLSGATRYAPSSGRSYISPQGIFANLAGISATSVTSGVNHRASICGLGFADLDKDIWDMGRESSAVVGVYGRASNSGTAPAYGGYFYDLKACGLILNRKFINDSDPAATQLNSDQSLIIGLCNKGETRTVYLPNDGVEGRIVIVKQMGAGKLRVDTSGGQTIYDNTSENDYYDFSEGEMGIFVFGIWNKGNVTTQVWSANRFKF